MALSDIVTVTITTEGVGVTQAGFGIALILSHRPTWPERVRSYTDLAGMVTDGFTSTTYEYKAAAKYFSQTPRPTKVYVGRCALPATQRFDITPTVLNSTAYSVKVAGTTVTYTSDADATADEIATGVAAAIDGAQTSHTGTLSSGKARITGDAAGNWLQLEVVDINLLSIAQNHADPGVATDLTAILNENSDWYMVINPFQSAAMITAIAAWCESNKKTFCATTMDTECATVVDGSATDIMKTLETAAYARTIIVYHPDNGAFIDAAWAGARLPFDPGSETWAFTKLAGVAAVTLTSTQKDNIWNKHGNVFYTVGGVTFTHKGWTPSGEFFDIIRFRDWVEARMSERVLALLAGTSKKIPYTDEGIARVESQVRSVLKDGVAVGGFAADPAFVITVPKAKDVSSADKLARTLNNVKWSATLAGAVHLVNLSGTVSF